MNTNVEQAKLLQLRLIVLLVLWCVLFFIPHALIAKDGTPTTKVEELQTIKLEHEIKKLQTEIELASGGWPKFAQAAPFITAIIALIGVFITIWKQISESSRQREVDRRQLEREQLRRFDEKFNQIVEGLGSPEAAIRAGAAVSILTYLRPEHSNLHEQVFLILMANLKIAHDEVTNSLLIQAFEHSIRIKSKEVEEQNADIEEKEDKYSLDLSHCNLAKVRLPGINLSWANVQESNLQHANLRGACLQRLIAQGANCSEAQISQADLTKAVFDSAVMQKSRFSASDLRWVHFKNADLRAAKFHRSLLQSALFNGADLRGAEFEQADINNAMFKGVTLDQAVMKSIVKSYNWRKAHFDEEVNDTLKDVELQVRAERNAQQ